MRSYLTILQMPGALAFCGAGLLARFGGAMVGIGTVLMVSSLYSSYGLAGGLSATNSVFWAIGTAWLSHMVDKRGQRAIMLPAALISAVTLAAMAACAFFSAPIPLLFVFSAISGFTGGSPGAMVRARWNYILSSSRDLHTAYSLESTLDELCFAAGPVLATWLATSVHPVAGLIGPVIFGAGGAMIFYSLRATEPRVLPSEPNERGHSRFLLAYPGIASVLAVGLLMGCLFGSIDVTVVAAATAWDARAQSGIILGILSLGSALGGLLYGSRGWSTALWKRFVIGVCLLGATVTPFFFSTGPVMLAILGFVAGVSIAPTFINANALIGKLVPANRLTEGLAWLGTGIGIGVSIGATGAGYVIDLSGYRAGFIAIVTCGLLACVVGLASAPVLRLLTSEDRASSTNGLSANDLPLTEVNPDEDIDLR